MNIPNRAALFGAILSLAFAASLHAQQVIPIYQGVVPGSENWTQQEREYYSRDWQQQIVANITRPTLAAYLPSKDKATGAGVLICGGGGFVALAVNDDRSDFVARCSQT